MSRLALLMLINDDFVCQKSQKANNNYHLTRQRQESKAEMIVTPKCSNCPLIE